MEKIIELEKVYEKETGVYGRSLFAKKSIGVGETVFIVCGKIVKNPSTYTIPIEYNLWIDPIDDVKYICHSCLPNCGIRNRTEVVAMKNIEKDDEITIDYAMIVPRFYLGAPGADIECICGSSNCRKRFVGYEELTEIEKEGYRGWISDYLLLP